MKNVKRLLLGAWLTIKYSALVCAITASIIVWPWVGLVYLGLLFGFLCYLLGEINE